MASTIEFADSCGDDGQVSSRIYTITTASTSFSTTFGRFSSVGVSISSNGNFWGHAARASGGIMVAAKSNGLSTGRLPIACFYDAVGAAVQVQISVSVAGEIIAWRGQESVELGRTGAGVVVPGNMNHYECETTIHASAGIINVWVNGNPTAALALTGKNTQSSANATYSVSGYGYFSSGFPGISSANYDDFIVRSGLGQKGDARCIYSPGTVAGSNAAWTPNASTNVSRIQETVPDDDTTFNSTLTVNAIDSFSSAALPSTVTAVLAVCPTFYARKDDASSHTIAGLLKSGATTQAYTAHAVTAVYARYQDIAETDPNTGSAWTIANVNAAERGYKLIT